MFQYSYQLFLEKKNAIYENLGFICTCFLKFVLKKIIVFYKNKGVW